MPICIFEAEILLGGRFIEKGDPQKGWYFGFLQTLWARVAGGTVARVRLKCSGVCAPWRRVSFAHHLVGSVRGVCQENNQLRWAKSPIVNGWRSANMVNSRKPFRNSMRNGGCCMSGHQSHDPNRSTMNAGSMRTNCCGSFWKRYRRYENHSLINSEKNLGK